MPMPWEIDWGESDAGAQAASQPEPVQQDAMPWEIDWGSPAAAPPKTQMERDFGYKTMLPPKGDMRGRMEQNDNQIGNTRLKQGIVAELQRMLDDGETPPSDLLAEYQDQLTFPSMPIPSSEARVAEQIPEPPAEAIPEPVEQPVLTPLQQLTQQKWTPDQYSAITQGIPEEIQFTPENLADYPDPLDPFPQEELPPTGPETPMDILIRQTETKLADKKARVDSGKTLQTNAKWHDIFKMPKYLEGQPTKKDYDEIADLEQELAGYKQTAYDPTKVERAAGALTAGLLPFGAGEGWQPPPGETVGEKIIDVGAGTVGTVASFAAPGMATAKIASKVPAITNALYRVAKVPKYGKITARVINTALANASTFGLHSQLQAPLTSSITERVKILGEAEKQAVLFSAAGALAHASSKGVQSLAYPAMFAIGYKTAGEGATETDKLISGFTLLVLHGVMAGVPKGDAEARAQALLQQQYGVDAVRAREMANSVVLSKEYSDLIKKSQRQVAREPITLKPKEEAVAAEQPKPVEPPKKAPAVEPVAREAPPTKPVAGVEPAQKPTIPTPKAPEAAPKAREAPAVAKPAAKPAGGEGAELMTSEKAQEKVDSIESRLQKDGVDIFKLYNPTDPLTKELGKSPEWKPMPPELIEAYRARDSLGSSELSQSIKEIKGNLNKRGITDEKEIGAILDYYALNEKSTDAVDQYMASEYTQELAKQPLKYQIEKIAIRLAILRGENIDDVGDISKNTLKDATLAARGITETFGYFKKKQPAKPAAEVPAVAKAIEDKPELMTPEEYALSEGMKFDPDHRAVSHIKDTRSALNESKPVSSETIDFYKMKLLDGYVKEGDRYVFKPTPLEQVKAKMADKKQAVREKIKPVAEKVAETKPELMTPEERIAKIKATPVLERDPVEVEWASKYMRSQVEAKEKADAVIARAETDALPLAQYVKDMSAMQRGKILSVLNKDRSINGKPDTQKDYVEREVPKGAKVVTLKNGRRAFQKPDGSFLYESDLSKAALDYAEHLPPLPPPAPIQPKPGVKPEVTTPEVAGKMKEAVKPPPKPPIKPPLPPAAPLSVEDALNQGVRVKPPKGATFVAATTADGKSAVVSINDISSLKEAGPYKSVKWMIRGKKGYVPVEGKGVVPEAKREKPLAAEGDIDIAAGGFVTTLPGAERISDMGREVVRWTKRELTTAKGETAEWGKIEELSRNRFNMVDIHAKQVANRVMTAIKALPDPVKAREAINMVMEGSKSVDKLKAEFGLADGHPVIQEVRWVLNDRGRLSEAIADNLVKQGKGDLAKQVRSNKGSYLTRFYMRHILGESFAPKPADFADAADSIKADLTAQVERLGKRATKLGRILFKTGKPDAAKATQRYLEGKEDAAISKLTETQQDFARLLRDRYQGMQNLIDGIMVDQAAMTRGKLIQFQQKTESLQNAARDTVDYILGKDTDGPSKGSSPIDMNHLTRRTLTPIFRKLFQEVDTPIERMQRTAEVQGNMLAGLELVNNITEQGAGVWWTKAAPDKAKGLTTRLSGTRFGKLDGAFVSKATSDLLDNAPKQASAVMRHIDDLVRYQRTIQVATSFPTTERNLLSGYLSFAIGSGDFLRRGFHGNMATATKFVAKLATVKKGTPEYTQMLETLEDLAKKGVFHVRESSIAEDIMGRKTSHGTSGDLLDRLFSPMKKVQKTAGKAYAYGDFITKYASYLTQKQIGKTDAEAAKHVQTFYQHPSSLPSLLRSFSKLPLADYPTYTFDSIRIKKNQIKNVVESAKKGDLRPLIGFVISNGIYAMMAGGEEWVRGMLSDKLKAKLNALPGDQLRAMKEFQPDYWQNKPMLARMGKDDAGKPVIDYVITGNVFAFPLDDAIMGAVQNRKFGDFIEETAGLFLKTGMTPNTISKALRGQETGLGASYYKTKGMLDLSREDPQASRKFIGILLRTALELGLPIPRRVQQAFRRWRSLEEKVASGKIDRADANEQISDILMSEVIPLKMRTITRDRAHSMIYNSARPTVDVINEYRTVARKGNAETATDTEKEAGLEARKVLKLKYAEIIEKRKRAMVAFKGVLSVDDIRNTFADLLGTSAERDINDERIDSLIESAVSAKHRKMRYQKSK